MAQHPDKNELLGRGLAIVRSFCQANELPTPAVEIVRDSARWRFNACAYYRQDVIVICVPACAPVGVAGPRWSWPGYVVDRTPYGVIAHELGHHADFYSGASHGKYFSDYGVAVRRYSGEPPITNYCPNNAEWFAEVMRLFITNPSLLRKMRPRAFSAIEDQFVPVEERYWADVLCGAPPRTLDAATKKIAKARRG